MGFAKRVNNSVKIALTIVAAVIVAGSFYADYRWRQWMAARKNERK
jgi:hypothetical protein